MPPLYELSEDASHEDALHVDVPHEKASASSSATSEVSAVEVTSLTASLMAVASATAALAFSAFATAVLDEAPDDPLVPGFDADDFDAASEMTSSAAEAVIRGGFADRPASSMPSSSVPTVS